VNSKFAKEMLEIVMKIYDDDQEFDDQQFTELIEGPIIEVPMTPEEFMNIEHTDFPNADDNDME